MESGSDKVLLVRPLSDFHVFQFVHVDAEINQISILHLMKDREKREQLMFTFLIAPVSRCLLLFYFLMFILH